MPKKGTKKTRGAKVLLQQQVAACIFLSRMPARTQKKALDAGHHSDPGGNPWKIQDFSKKNVAGNSVDEKIVDSQGLNKIQLFKYCCWLTWGIFLFSFCYGGDPKIW